MVNLLIGSKDIEETNIFHQTLTNDKEYRIKIVDTGANALSTYLKLKPDILVLDNSLSDIPISDIIDRLSFSPIERKKCNTILTVSQDYNIKLNNVSKINKIIYKPILNNELVNALHLLSEEYTTPDLENGEVDSLLILLNFNYSSAGFIFMKEAIIYCYYHPEQLAFLNNIQKLLAQKYSVPESRVRDAMNSSIRPYNTKNCYLDQSSELYKMLYNNGYKLSLKDFLERIVIYLIKTKGRTL